MLLPNRKKYIYRQLAKLFGDNRQISIIQITHLTMTTTHTVTELYYPRGAKSSPSTCTCPAGSAYQVLQ